MKTVEERRLKCLLKEAVVEVLEERTDLLSDAVREGLEDAALLRAIQEGERTPLVRRDRVLRLLESRR